jgi:signal transduction histidine kinase
MSFRLGLIAAVGVSLMALLCVGVLSYRKLVHEDEDQRWVVHTHEVLQKLGAIRVDLSEQEMGAQAFITTGEEAGFHSYESGRRQLQTDMAQVRELTQDNPRQQRTLDHFEPLVAARDSELAKAIATHPGHQPIHQVAMTGEENGERTADAIQAAIAGMVAEETRLRIQRLQSAQQSSQTTKILIVAGNAVAFSFLFVAGVVISREMGRRHKAEEEVLRSNTELKAANKELQAFSYSVSHDLRSPLRSIDGFSLALLEDYQDKLDADGQDHLRRIRGATDRMAQLIDGMLNLARISRAAMARENVDLSSLAREIAAELQTSQPERRAAFSIPASLPATGDRVLLRVVLENLLSNAWKFTRELPNACIELGTQPNGSQRTYFVRDNGAGFDMHYAEKLFGVFQRMHRQSEFPGTGVGLATVQRIIHRHGGRIWAEAKPSQGATFYFVLGD